MDKHKLILPISILLECIILGGFIYASQASKQRSIERQQKTSIDEKDSNNSAVTQLQEILFQSEKTNNEKILHAQQVELNYNKRTGELCPVFNGDIEPHTCVWTLLSKNGSYTTLITRVNVVVGSVGYVGHVISKDYFDVLRKSDEFWPSWPSSPTEPIYVTCVDSNNNVYQGTYNK